MKSSFCLFLAFASLAFMPAQDELSDENTVANFKAAFLFQFATSNNWKNTGNRDSFTIGVISSQAVFEELVDKFANKPVGAQSLKVVMMEKSNQLSDIQLLYLSKPFCKEKPAEAQKWISDCEGKPILVVSDHSSGHTWGSAINFKVVDNRVRYSVNSENALKQGVTLGSKIISWAVQD